MWVRSNGHHHPAHLAHLARPPKTAFPNNSRLLEGSSPREPCRVIHQAHCQFPTPNPQIFLFPPPSLSSNTSPSAHQPTSPPAHKDHGGPRGSRRSLSCTPHSPR